MRFLHTLLALSLFGIASAKAQGFTKTEFKDSDGTRLRYAILKPAKIKPAKIKPAKIKPARLSQPRLSLPRLNPTQNIHWS
jgi:hypothetical protein